MDRGGAAMRARDLDPTLPVALLFDSSFLDPLSPGWLRIDPTHFPLKGNPRFERLVGGS
jgi:hypothetical protein